MYSYAPALQRFSKSLHAIHFLGGQNKPWLARLSQDGTWRFQEKTSLSLGMQKYLEQWWSHLLNTNLLYVLDKLGGLGKLAPESHLTLPSYSIAPSFPYSYSQAIANDSEPTTSPSLTSIPLLKSKPSSIPQSISNYRVSWAPDLQKTFEYFRPTSGESSPSGSSLSPTSILLPERFHPSDTTLAPSSSENIATKGLSTAQLNFLKDANGLKVPRPSELSSKSSSRLDEQAPNVLKSHDIYTKPSF
jgi:hypothetical protein